MTDTTITGEQPTSARALLECDIVMAGGVTSGIIYPGAVATISQRYAFRSIGGTSVGAMAAAATAAAEYGRLTNKNKQSFEYIGELAKTLSDAAGDGHSRLFHLFTPEPATTPLLALVTPLFGGGGFFKQATGIFKSTMRAWQIALTVIITGLAALWMLYVLVVEGQAFADLVTDLIKVLTGLIGLIAAMVLLAAAWLGALLHMLTAHWLPAWRENGFGICTGGSQFGAAAKSGQEPFDGLSLWMHKVVQKAAGRRPEDDPMTFGDLWGASPTNHTRQTNSYAPRTIELSMIASDISRNRTVQLPFMEALSPVYVDRNVLARYLPEKVITWMWDHQGQYDERFEKQPGFFRLPLPHDLPLVFTARLSLSFPVLLSAFPLLTPDFAAPKSLSGKIPLRRLWLSDGGLTSNFPIHFFDSPVPARPTFCLNLIDYDAGTDGAAADPAGREGEHATANTSAGKPISEPRSERRKTSARPEQSPARDPIPGDDVWGFISMADGNRIPLPPFTEFDAPGAGLIPFFTTLLNTARFWSDNQMLVAPGIRDRVVNIALLDTEGGLNLDMPAKTISELNFRGRAAGMLISARYDSKARIDPETGQPNHEIFPNHRWVRFRNFMAAFEDMSRRFVSSLRDSDKAATLRGESQLAEMIAGTAPEKLGYPAPPLARDYYLNTTKGFENFAVGMANETRANAHATFDMPRKFGPAGAFNPPGAAPRQKMRFHLRPLGDNDPRAESAPLP